MLLAFVVGILLRPRPRHYYGGNKTGLDVSSIFGRRLSLSLLLSGSIFLSRCTQREGEAEQGRANVLHKSFVFHHYVTWPLNGSPTTGGEFPIVALHQSVVPTIGFDTQETAAKQQPVFPIFVEDVRSNDHRVLPLLVSPLYKIGRGCAHVQLQISQLNRLFCFRYTFWGKYFSSRGFFPSNALPRTNAVRLGAVKRQWFRSFVLSQTSLPRHFTSFYFTWLHLPLSLFFAAKKSIPRAQRSISWRLRLLRRLASIFRRITHFEKRSTMSACRQRMPPPPPIPYFCLETATKTTRHIRTSVCVYIGGGGQEQKTPSSLYNSLPSPSTRFAANTSTSTTIILAA